MNNLPEATTPALDRQDVLDAIDCEITHRESILSRHGISTWGIIAATCALLWAAATEALSARHNWTNAFLVMLACNWVLGFLASPWLKALGIGNLKGDSAYSVKELILRFGIQAGSIPYHVVHTGLLLIVALYVGLKGFLLLSITTSAFCFMLLLCLGCCWLVCHVQVPLRIPVQPLKPKTQIRAKILSQCLLIVMALVPLDAVASVWPVEASDIRLGLMLGALASLWGLSITIIRPPTATTSLRDLRSRLAFGEIGIEEAKTKAQCILRGSPEEYYLMTKADEAAAELKEYIRLCSSICDQGEQVILLGDRLRAANSDQAVLHETASEFRSLHKTMLSDMRDMDKRMETALGFRRELHLRVEVAKVFLKIKAETRSAIVKQVDDLGKDTIIARQKFANRAEQFRSALDFLYQFQKGVKLPRKLTLLDAYVALFRA